MRFYSVLLGLLLFLPVLGYNWWMRRRFVVEGFQQPGTYMKKIRAYKERWNYLQQVLLVPMFSSYSDRKYKSLAVVNYLHFLVAVHAMCGHILEEYYAINIVWGGGMAVKYGMAVNVFFVFAQTILINVKNYK